MIEDKIKKMSGKYWMYKTRNVLIESVKITTTKISIIIENDVIQYDYTKSGDIFKDFLPTSQNEALQKSEKNLPVNFIVSSEMMSLTNTIKESIEKIKTDKTYIPQANAINSSVNTLINMAKLELLTHRLK